MNIYLIAASSYHLINREIKNIVKNRNYLTMSLNKVSLEDVIKEASYFSLDPNQKIIVVSNANYFSSAKTSDKDNELLLNYLTNPNSQTIIIFTTQNGVDLRKKCVKLIKEKYCLINIPDYSWKDTEAEIKKYVKEHGYTIDSDAINYIMNNTSSLDMIYNECDKLFLYYNAPGKIKIEDVKKIVGSIIDNNNFHFVSAVVAKNLPLSLKLLQNLKVYKVEPISLIILLAREYRLMYYLKRYQKNKYTMAMICKELGLQDWQVNKLYNNSISFSEDELLTNIKKLACLDLGIKKGLFDKDAAIVSFLVDICN